MSEDFVLSEIHAEKEGCKSQLLFESKDFELNGHLITECSVFNVLHDTGVYHDQDGDLKVVRKPKDVPVSGNTQENVWRIKIYHQMATPLSSVGLQLWAGSLLMADYLLSKPETVRGKKVLEIGCGVGFISIIHSRIGDTNEILCTDYLPCVLKLAEQNYQGNLHGVCKAKFEQFDLTESSDKFQSKLKQLNFEPDIVLAGDVTYSPELTEAFVMHLKWLLKPRKRAIISLKKRMVFHVLPMNSDESESHVYDAHFVHFLNCLKEGKQLRIKYMPVDDVKQRILGYRRESNMVLLEILHDERAYFSNYGKCVDLFAPGHMITGAWIGSKTAEKTISGTSMASPHVAAVLALLAHDHPDMSPEELKSHLLSVATKNALSDIGEDSPNLLLYSDPKGHSASDDQAVMDYGWGNEFSFDSDNLRHEQMVMF